MKSLKTINYEIINHPTNQWAASLGYKPIYSVSEHSKIVLISQAPGRVSQSKNIAWDDVSGNTLRNWLGVTKDEFYDVNNFAILPMDFYYPGKGIYGDLPPRNDFASLWHPRIIKFMTNIRLIILIGSYSQNYYLPNTQKRNLTQNVKNFSIFLPDYFPIVHPSPLNFSWKKSNSWFENDVLPILKNTVRNIIND